MTTPTRTTQPTPLLDVVERYLTDDRWNYRRHENAPVITFAFRGDHGAWQCLINSREQHSQVVLFSSLGLVVPSDKLDLTAEALHRINYGLVCGNFEFDYRAREIRFKSSSDAEGGIFTGEMVRKLVLVHLRTVDRYLPAILPVLFGDLSPEAAVAAVEIG